MRSPPWFLGFLAVSALESSCLASQGAVTTPEKHLGRPLAADFHLPDWKEVKAYFEALDAQSENVVTKTVGKTTEGRDFVLCTISSAANLKDLERLRGIARQLADPRGASAAAREEAVKSGKVFLFVSCAMHATECASPQFAMQFAHDLATSAEEPWRSAREDLVVLLAPSLNPDGLDHVTEWYRRVVGTPYEASELPKLYQLYAGHDNNRDWFTLTQAETRLVTRLLYEEWFPQVYWDVHQQGSSQERMFVPPFRDPLSPNLDPAVIGAINLLGTRAQLDLTREGKTGVATGGTYDMWWNGGNRNVPVRHNIVGLLTEAASARLASPIFLEPTSLRAPDGTPGYMPSNRFPAPWPGGWWRLRDIVDYEMAFARSLCASLSRERALYLRNALEAADRSLAKGRDDAPIAWLLPADQRDPGATERLADVLLATGVELDVADGPVVADGRSYPAGSIVIRREQPYGNHVKDLFDVQRYPDGDAPYDVAGWTLPYLFGVRRVEVVEKLEAKTHRAETIEAATAGIPRGRALTARDSNAWKQVFARLAKGESFVFSAGTFEPRAERDPAEGAVSLERMPRIGLYAPWSGSMDEGWTRWVLDTFGVPYTSVRNEMLRAGELGAFLDVLVIPSLDARELDRGRAGGSAPPELVGGLDPEGAVAVEEFVRAGGTLVAIGSSSKWAVELLRLPLAVAPDENEAKTFSCPGSVLRAVAGSGVPFTADLDESVPVFFSRGNAWREMSDKEREEIGLAKGEKPVQVLLRYAPTRLLLSGWIKTPEVIAGKGAWVRVEHGKGAVHLFGFRPQYRGWSQAAFQLLFRAMLLEPAKAR